MLIDFHTHIFPDKIAEKTMAYLESRCHNHPFTDGTAQGLVNAMERADADIAVNLPVLTKPSQFESITRFALSVNEQYANAKRRIISFGGIHPACDDIKGKMRFLKDNGFIGVKIHPDYQETFLEDDGYIQVLTSAKDLDMVVVTHSGVDDGYLDQPVRCTPSRVKKVIEAVGHEKFVLGHYGALDMWEETLDILADKNVYFDTAFTLHRIDKELFEKILDRHGDDKVLFASDCPWADIVEHKKILLSYGLNKDTEEKILYKNAMKLLKIGG